METEYERQGHRVQTAIAMILELDPDGRTGTPKDLRVGIDMSKADHAGLATLLMEKGVFTLEEYLAALTKAATEEADRWETALQAIMSHRGVRTA